MGSEEGAGPEEVGLRAAVDTEPRGVLVDLHVRRLEVRVAVVTSGPPGREGGYYNTPPRCRCLIERAPLRWPVGA